jgi:hypothetical protein
VVRMPPRTGLSGTHYYYYQTFLSPSDPSLCRPLVMARPMVILCPFGKSRTAQIVEPGCTSFA